METVKKISDIEFIVDKYREQNGGCQRQRVREWEKWINESKVKKKMLTATRGCKTSKDSPPTVTRGNAPCQHLDFRLLASRM